MSRSEPSDRKPADVRRTKTWLWIAGLASMLLGAVGLVFPFILTVAAELLLGTVLAAIGAIQLLRGFLSGDVVSRGWTLLFGIFALGGGVLLLLYPLEGVLTLTLVLAGFFIAGGLSTLFGAWQMRPTRMRDHGLDGGSGRGWLALSGVLSLVLGLLLFFGLPSTAAWALGLLLGIDLLFLGVSEITLAMRLDRIMGDEVSA